MTPFHHGQVEEYRERTDSVSLEELPPWPGEDADGETA